MPQTVNISKEKLEAMIEQRAAARSAINPRGTGAPSAQDRQPQEGAWRGSQMFTSAPQMSAEDAKDVMSFFRGINSGDYTTVQRSLTALNGRVERLQQVGVNADGGYAVPYQFLTEVTVALPRVTPFADSSIIRILPMESETTRWTKVTTKPAAPGIVAEGAAYSKTGVTFGLIELVARKIGEIVPLTQEILDSNQIEMVSLIAELVAEQLAYKRNALVTNGSGAGEPEGVMTNAGVTSFAWDATSSATKSDSVIGMYHALPSQYRRDAIWLLNDASIKVVRQLKDSQNRYLWTDGFGATPPTLMGRPVFENGDLTTSQVLFGNFRRGYVLGQRKGLLVEQNSSGTDWEKDIINFKFRERYDGKVNDEKAFVKSTNFA